MDSLIQGASGWEEATFQFQCLGNDCSTHRSLFKEAPGFIPHGTSIRYLRCRTLGPCEKKYA
jgi:hypothetical protein